MRETLRPSVFATQTALAPTAIADGAPPTGIVVVAPDAGSIRVTTPSPAQATQTAPAPYATASGRFPTLNSLRRPSSNVSGSKRSTLASPEFATHTEPLPTTTPAGAAPASEVPTTRTSSGSTFTSNESPYTAHTAPEPTVTPASWAAGGARIASIVFTWSNWGSTRDNWPRAPCATQTALAPNATADGVRLSSGMVLLTTRFAASILVRFRSSRLPTQTEPAPTA